MQRRQSEQIVLQHKQIVQTGGVANIDIWLDLLKKIQNPTEKLIGYSQLPLT